jgi:hypothetical protein
MNAAGPLIIAVTLLLSAAARAQDAAVPEAAAATPDQPYASIISRNMFGLVPIPTNNPADALPPADPPPKITPNGIMTIFGRLQALFKVANKGKPGQPPKDDSYVLAEGERQDEIEVVKINQPDGIVTFNNHGVLQELPLTPAANASGPAPGGGPGMGGPGMGGPGLPGLRPPGAMTPAERAAMRRAAAQNPGGGMQPQSFQSPSTQTPNNIEDQVMSAAKEMALIEQNRIATQDAVDAGVMPPLPPTLLTPSDARGQGGSPLIVNPNDTQPSSASH